jgi:hypothetical protein
MLTAAYRRMYQPTVAMIAPEEVIAVLKQAGIQFVLMGTHGIGGWRSEPRATQDVGILVPKRHHRKARAVIHRAYPDLDVQDGPAVTRFVDPATRREVIDLMKPAQPVYQMVFRQTIPVGDSHRVPNLEMALVAKFAAMVSPNRTTSKKYVDAGDFIDMVQHNSAAINRVKLRRLGDKVYPGGGEEVVRMMEDAKAGRHLQF